MKLSKDTVKTTCDCCDCEIVVEERSLMGAEIALCPHCAGDTIGSKDNGIVVGIYNGWQYVA